MLKKIIIWSLVSLVSLFIILVSFVFWFKSVLPTSEMLGDHKNATPENLTYLTENIIPHRGKILTVVTSVDVMGSSGKATGYELTELSRAYYVFLANGYEVDIASPKGGEPPVVIDDEDMGAYDYAFLSDSEAQHKAKNTLPMSAVNPDEYEAIYFVGGKGAMFDFPDNEHIQSLVSNLYQSGKVVGAVCHGPAALVNVKLDNGSYLLENKRVSSFTNTEELFLISDAKEIFPYLLEDKMVERGANYDEGYMYLENVVKTGKLITGQNPWSTWPLAETMIREMGHTPKARPITSEELGVGVLNAYEKNGYDEAKKVLMETFSKNDHNAAGRFLIAKHGVLSAMQFRLGKMIDILRLLKVAKELNTNS